MTKPDLMHLSCALCQWVIPEEITLALVAEHFKTEHPEHVKEDEEPKIDLEMVAVCLQCKDILPLFATLDEGDHWRHTYNCEKCGRGYTINQRKEGAS